MENPKRIIAPSILAADFSCMAQSVNLAESVGAQWLHLDIMDGQFVPSITFGAQMVAAIRKCTSLVLDAHLMTLTPAAHLASFAEAGVDRFTFHIETEIHAHRLLSAVRALGIKTGIAIVPSTPVSSVTELLEYVDQILVMTVNPGWGGQKLIPRSLNKIKELAGLREAGAGNYVIAMDGGFGLNTASAVWNSGCDMAVMGSAFFGADNPESAFRDCLMISDHNENLQ